MGDVGKQDVKEGRTSTCYVLLAITTTYDKD